MLCIEMFIGITIEENCNCILPNLNVGGRSRECFFWALPKRSIPKPDPHRKDTIQRESLSTDML